MSPPEDAWLIEKSAFNRPAVSRDAAGWLNRSNRGLIRISTVTRLEIGYSARSAGELRADLTRPPLSLLPSTSGLR